MEKLSDYQSVCNIWSYSEEVFFKVRIYFLAFIYILEHLYLQLFFPQAEANSYHSVILPRLLVLSFPGSAPSTSLPHGRGS